MRMRDGSSISVPDRRLRTAWHKLSRQAQPEMHGRCLWNHIRRQRRIRSELACRAADDLCPFAGQEIERTVSPLSP